MTKKDKAFNGLVSAILENEQSFWNKWLVMHELDQEKYVQKLVPVIERHWSALDKISKKVGEAEVLRLKASLLNSYFIDLLGTIYAQKRKKKL